MKAIKLLLLIGFVLCIGSMSAQSVMKKTVMIANMYDTPNMATAKVVFSSIPANTEIKILKTADKLFYQVEYKNTKGYMTKSSFHGGSMDEMGTKKKTVRFATMFDTSNMATAKIVFSFIPVGTEIEILRTVDIFYQVKYQNTTGYMTKNCFHENTSVDTKPNNSIANIQNNATAQQNKNYTYHPASPQPSFETMLSGVRDVIIFMPSESYILRAGYIKYLKEMGFENIIALDSKDLNSLDKYHLRKDLLILIPRLEDSEFTFDFLFLPLGYTWKFTSKITFNDLRSWKYQYYDEVTKSYEVFRKAYGFKKPPYYKMNELCLPKRKTKWSEWLIKEDFKEHGIQTVEGIYENSSEVNQAKYCVAVKNVDGQECIIYLSGAYNKEDWDEGEIKATLTPTATPHLYKANWIMANKTENDNFYISFEQGFMNVIDPNGEKNVYIKMYPSAGDIASPKSPSSGTGFAITSNGLIVTNHHVIERATSIKVRGVNGDFGKSYSAKVMVDDKNNDLALIKIDDSSFTGLGTIPFTIKASGVNVGENVFVLGYPLRETMGDEIKLTNGIVSSKTGFQEDVTTYQISVPIQPGNSGGPLFDSQGNLVGIVNAKHSGAENVSYAIKTNYLLNLINSLDNVPALQKVSTVQGKTLSQQTSILKNKVFIIEVN